MIQESAETAREEIIRMQVWASTMTPQTDPRVQKLVQALSQARDALETLMFAK